MVVHELKNDTFIYFQINSLLIHISHVTVIYVNMYMHCDQNKIMKLYFMISIINIIIFLLPKIFLSVNRQFSKEGQNTRKEVSLRKTYGKTNDCSHKTRLFTKTKILILKCGSLCIG